MCSAPGAAYKPQLLLIEDNPGDARLVREALRQAKPQSDSFQLHWVDRLQKGLTLLAEQKTDLVLLDLSLPDAQGLAGMKHLRVCAPDIPIIVLTGMQDEHAALEALQLGAQDYLVKDELQGKLLARSIRYALERMRERKRFESQLVQAQKMDALGRLAGGVAHDFNNIVTIILGHAELHLAALPADSPSRQHVLPIISAANRAASLTRQLLAFSRKQAHRPELLDIGPILSEFGKMLRRVIDERIEITIRTVPDLGYIKADRTQVEQVILNLAINARDAMPKGGRLVIEAGNATIADADQLCHDPIEPGEYVVLTVADTGIGMDEATRDKIFEPFFTTKPPGQGTGLGLAMVYGIVTQNGGHIWVYSEKDCGTTFKVYLPRFSGFELSVASRPIVEAARRGTETILVVEDENNLRSLVEGILTGWGYRVLLAGDGEQALEICRNYQGTIDLVITDIVMPRMSGVELIRQVRQLHPETLYVCMSGYPGDLALRNDVIDANHYLQKPFAPSELSRLLRRILD
jgi:signal transduction histidine kinase